MVDALSDVDLWPTKIKQDAVPKGFPGPQYPNATLKISVLFVIIIKKIKIMFKKKIYFPLVHDSTEHVGALVV